MAMAPKAALCWSAFLYIAVVPTRGVAFELSKNLLDRIDQLLIEMNLEEKIGQLSMSADTLRQTPWGVNPDWNNADSAKLLDNIRAGKVGSVFNGFGATSGREVQRVAVEESRLGIPLLFAADVIHGMGTVFPIPLGEAASFEPALAERTARATAMEATAQGIHWTFAPMVDVGRDQRWGRVCEGSGEDVHLGAEFAAARVRGFHGGNLSAADSLLATPKHFLGYGAVEAGLDYNTVGISEITLRDVHLPGFQAAIDAGALTVMSAFTDTLGVPATANSWLLKKVLRDELNFDGFVLSDYASPLELIQWGIAGDKQDAAFRAFSAGTDMEMQSGLYNQYLPDLVKNSHVSSNVIDSSVRRVLSVKAAVGLFDNPYRSLDRSTEADGVWSSHDGLALEAGRRSIVLLKNEGNILPLRKMNQRIALIGPFGSDIDNVDGCWALFGDKSRAVSIEEGILGALLDPSGLTVVKGSGVENPIDGGIEAAIEAARTADVILLAIGEGQDFSGESQSRTQIVVPPAQQVLAEAVAHIGKPLVVLLKTGRALALTGAVRDAEAILVTWFLGTKSGLSIRDVLFGDYNPSGRLPVSFPIDIGQQPYYYSHPNTGRPWGGLGHWRAYTTHWREAPHEALYPFGHGLSYTNFTYSAPRLNNSVLTWHGALSINCEIRNSGGRAGEEVAQLYIHDRVASQVRPVRELKAFEKVLLQPGEYVQVNFVITREALAFHAANGTRLIEPGVFDLWIAPSAILGESVSFELTSESSQHDRVWASSAFTVLP